MRVAIVCAMDEEINKLRAVMENARTEERAGIRVTEGRLSGHEIALYLGGIGKSNAAATVQYAVCAFRPDLLVNIGLAGNCTGTLPLGGAVIADRLVYHDFKMEWAAENPPHKEFFTPTAALRDKMRAVCDSLGVQTVSGTVATGDVFVQEEAVKNDIVARTGASAVEMEGAAFAHMAEKNGVDYVVVKIMSENASDGALDDFHASLPLGAYCDTSVSILRGLLNSL